MDQYLFKKKLKELSKPRKIKCTFPGFTIDVVGSWNSSDLPTVDDVKITSVVFTLPEVEEIFFGPKFNRNNAQAFGKQSLREYVEDHAFNSIEFQKYVKEVHNFIYYDSTEENWNAV